jgi:hypothetical protein
MMEPTVTENSALYFVQHKITRRRSGVLRQLSLAAWRERWRASQPEIRDNVFVWPRIQWQA